MPELPRSSALLRRVAMRIRLVSIARRSFFALLLVASLFAIWVAVQRFTGLITHYFDDPMKLGAGSRLPIQVYKDLSDILKRLRHIVGFVHF